MTHEKILIIEDDEDIREGIRILLESEQYLIMEAGSGKEGLQLLGEDTSLVVLDIMMPGMTGLRTCEEIRKISNVPVLFLTAKSQESDKLIGLMAGGDDYLSFGPGTVSRCPETYQTTWDLETYIQHSTEPERIYRLA